MRIEVEDAYAIVPLTDGIGRLEGIERVIFALGKQTVQRIHRAQLQVLAADLELLGTEGPFATPPYCSKHERALAITDIFWCALQCRQLKGHLAHARLCHGGQDRKICSRGLGTARPEAAFSAMLYSKRGRYSLPFEAGQNKRSLV